MPCPMHDHCVFVTKYRKPVQRGEMGSAVRELIREICRANDLEILQRALARSCPSVGKYAPAPLAESDDRRSWEDVASPFPGSSAAEDEELADMAEAICGE